MLIYGIFMCICWPPGYVCMLLSCCKHAFYIYHTTPGFMCEFSWFIPGIYVKFKFRFFWFFHDFFMIFTEFSRVQRIILAKNHETTHTPGSDNTLKTHVLSITAYTPGVDVTMLHVKFMNFFSRKWFFSDDFF